MSYLVEITWNLGAWWVVLIGIAVLIVMLIVLAALRLTFGGQLLEKDMETDSGENLTGVVAGEGSVIQRSQVASDGGIAVGGNMTLQQTVGGSVEHRLEDALERAVSDAERNIELTGFSRVSGVMRTFADILYHHPQYLTLKESLRNDFEGYYDRIRVQTDPHPRDQSPWIGIYFTNHFIPAATAFVINYKAHSRDEIGRTRHRASVESPSAVRVFVVPIERARNGDISFEVHGEGPAREVTFEYSMYAGRSGSLHLKSVNVGIITLAERDFDGRTELPVADSREWLARATWDGADSGGDRATSEIHRCSKSTSRFRPLT